MKSSAAWTGPVQAIRETPPPAQRGFTLADQVNQLVGASEADPDLGFMARTMALCSLPRTNPGNRHQYKRVNGPFTLYMNATADHKLPYGNLPRLLLAWVCTEAVRTGSREIVLGKSLSEFMRSLGVYSSAGGVATRLRNQMRRLFHCTVSLIYEDERGAASASSLVADRTEFWWNERKPDEPMLWDSKIYLGEAFFNEIIRHPVPIEINTLTALKRSTLGLDLYLWLVYRTFPLRAPLRLSWRQVYRQFGVDPAKDSDKRTVLNFRTKVLRELKKIKLAWPELNYATAPGVLILSPSKPAMHPRPAHSVSWSSPRDRPGAPEREPGCFRWRRTTFYGKAENPHPKGRLKPGKFRRGPPADAVRALRLARATGQRQSVVPEMPPVPQEGPLTRPGATNAGRDTLFPTSHRRAA